jgi:plasmid stabilization system protein ParE
VVEWSEPARVDLRALYEFIALDSPFYARTTIRTIVERAAGISETPEIGRVVPELGEDNIREVFIFSYRVIYQIFPDKVTVLTVVHGYRDLQGEYIPVIR